MVFSDMVRPKLDYLGGALSWVEMDTGKKTDQVFHELIAEEYNKANVVEYGTYAFPYLNKGRAVPPSHFQEIDWEKSKDSWKGICNKYDYCFKAWKQAGFHGVEIPSNVSEMVKVASKPFDTFANSNSSILYMHEFVCHFPNILDRITGEMS